MGGLIKALSSQPAKLLSIIREFPENTEPLILRIITVMAAKEPISEELMETVVGLYHERGLDARFLIPVIVGLPKVRLEQQLKNQAQILAELPKILQLLDGSDDQKKMVQDVMLKLVQSKTMPGVEPGTEIVKPSVLTPVEYMIALHTMEEAIGLKRAVEGILSIR